MVPSVGSVRGPGRGEQLLDRAEVVRRAGHHDEVLGAGVEVLLPGRDLVGLDRRPCARSRSGCRSSLAHHSSSTAFLAAKFAGGPNVFHASACSATSRSVTFSPLPPIRIGRSPAGGGVELPEPVDDQRERLGEVAQPRRRGA